MQAPKENLSREVAFEKFETRDSGGDGLTLEGYGAVFNSDAVIDSWEGNFVERFAPGSFKRTLKNQKPVMQFDHGRDSRVGSTPIGAFEILQEDETGLFIRARLHDNEQVKPVRDAIASGAISGMSIRFSVVKEQWDEPADAKSLPVRTITEARLFETGPVVFPAYAETSVGVRSQAEQLARDPEFRDALLETLRAELGYQISEPAGTPDGSADTSDRSTEHDGPDRGAAEENAEPAAGTSEPDLATGTSDASSTEPDADSEPAGTPDEGPAATSEEHSGEPHSPAVRASMPLERRRRDVSEIREAVAAAAAKDW